MIKVYSDEDLWNAMRQRRRILTIYFLIGLIVAGCFAVVTAFYCLLPYKDAMGVWYKVIASALVALFIIFSFPYLGISFHRVNAYYKMLKFISIGLKEHLVAPFEGVEDWETRDGVDVNVASFTVRSAKKDEFMSRHIFIDGEKDFPEFKEGEKVRMILQGNLLVEYEMLENEGETEQCAQS